MTIESKQVDSLEAGVPSQVATPADFAPAAPAPQPAAVNPLMARIQMPGETFKLPSCGLFYKDGELDPSVKDAEVHVHPMTVLDEIMIKTPDMLFSGKAVEDVFSRCIPEVAKPTRLLAKDVDFLLLCLRKVSYGDTLEMESGHYGCSKVEKGKPTPMHTYALDVNHFIRNSRRIDPTTAAKLFQLTLPNDQTVYMQPVRFDDFVKLMQAQEKESTATPDEQVTALVETLAGIIVRVDEVTDPVMISEWLRAIKPEYLSKLNEQLEKTVQWGPDFTYKVECKDCGETQEVVAPLNPLAFFT